MLVLKVQDLRLDSVSKHFDGPVRSCGSSRTLKNCRNNPCPISGDLKADLGRLDVGSSFVIPLSLLASRLSARHDLKTIISMIKLEFHNHYQFLISFFSF